MEVLHIENLSFTYPREEKPALVDINLDVRQGEFLVVCGESGCGKTTLLKLLKRELAPAGTKLGVVRYQGCSLDELDDRTAASEIGYVSQNPDTQIVTDKVWHELAFALENLGMENQMIRRRVGEMASYFGIQDWFRKSTDELSGGQKQLLNLAAVMVMQPKVLILDEPTSQLDPIAASDFIATLLKLNRELALTIILVEHRLEDVFPIADRVLVMENGKVLCLNTPENVGQNLKSKQVEHPISLGLPSAVRIFQGLQITGKCPLTVKDARWMIQSTYANKIDHMEQQPYIHKEKVMLELQNVWFRYERNLDDVLRGVNLKIYQGEIFCMLGGNGTGKTTTLQVLSGISRAYRGKVLVNNKKIREYKGNSLYRNLVAVLPQNPQTVFIKSSVREDFTEILKVMEITKEERTNRMNQVANKLHIEKLLDKHPYDLSGGEQQKCALAKMLLLEPEILLLDEPTKGMDAYSRKNFGDILLNLQKENITIMMVTHDIEFAAEYSNRCALFFDGEVSSVDTPQRFFDQNNFYTTAANRIVRDYYCGAVTCEQVIKMCKQNEKRPGKTNTFVDDENHTVTNVKNISVGEAVYEA